jgi:hypothetical protein
MLSDVDYCADLTDPQNIYLSSIQIELTHRGGSLFKLLLSSLLVNLRSEKFSTIKSNIQKSNSRMIGIAKKLGFVLEENTRSPGTLNVYAKREILDSPELNRFSARIECPNYAASSPFRNWDVRNQRGFRAVLPCWDWRRGFEILISNLKRLSSHGRAASSVR